MSVGFQLLRCWRGDIKILSVQHRGVGGVILYQHDMIQIRERIERLLQIDNVKIRHYLDGPKWSMAIATKSDDTHLYM